MKKRRRRRPYVNLLTVSLALNLLLGYKFIFASSNNSNIDISKLNDDKSIQEIIDKNNKENEELKKKLDSLDKKDNKTTENTTSNKDNTNKDTNKDKESQPNTQISAKGLNHKPEAAKYAYDTKTVRENQENSEYKGKKLAFLTFDDGPNNSITISILDTLKKENVPATFFVLGSNIGENTAETIKRIYNEGHALANHSYTHDYDILYPNRIPNPDVVLKEFTKTNEKLQEILGKDFNTKVFRYPGGHLSWDKEGIAKADTALRTKGAEWIDWNSMNGDGQPSTLNDPNDITRPTNTSEVIANFEKSLNLTSNPNQIVILMHDAPTKSITAEALPELIKNLKAKGYEFGILK